jgi:ABC-type glutathione transport system ATPase component
MRRDALFRVENLHLSLPDLNAKPLFGPAPQIEILKGLSFEIPKGRITGIVGESGSGKSTLGRCLVRLLRPSSGAILFDGKDIAPLDEVGLAPLRRDLQMIFQDPMSSLNPRHRIGQIIAGPLKINGATGDLRARVADALTHAQLNPNVASRYPHQLSGGQRQRVGIARAIALEPRFILADEIVSGLDVSTQAQIITLLERLVAEMDLTLAFISHDLSVIRRLCSHVIVLQAGEIVEQGETAAIFDAPTHPYTRTLRDAIPLPEIDADWLETTE